MMEYTHKRFEHLDIQALYNVIHTYGVTVSIIIRRAFSVAGKRIVIYVHVYIVFFFIDDLKTKLLKSPYL